VQLSPKSIFFGLVAFGLPIAVAVGWTSATPHRSVSEVSLPGGAGGIGAAPLRAGTTTPVTARYSPSPDPSPTASPTPSGKVSPPTHRVSSPPSATPSAPSTSEPESAWPTLTQPPVPTPTDIVVTDDPSTPVTVDPSMGDNFPFDWRERRPAGWWVDWSWRNRGA
jgi:hypothetical protein